MTGYRITGGRRLCGRLKIHGAKNAVLPILAAALLCEEDCRIENCPDLSDVAVSISILQHLGVSAERKGETLCLSPKGEGDPVIPAEWMHAMRSSILFLAPMLARFGRAEITAPGGCSIGARPIDLHLSALQKMGAVIEQTNETLIAAAPHGLYGAEITLPLPSVGATETVLIAAAAACGESHLIGAAREPEIDDLIRFLNTCGADITVLPDGVIRIVGKRALCGGRHTVIPDRIAAATYLAAAAVTGGEITLQTDWRHLRAPLALLRRAGCSVFCWKDAVTLCAPERTEGMGSIVTLPYPGFPTDLQAVMMAVAACSHGMTTFTENIFENRFGHAAELRRMGADITVMGSTAVVSGVPCLHGAHLRCPDLRGGAALVLAALAASGESTVTGIHHIERGYQHFLPTLRTLGALISPLEE